MPIYTLGLIAFDDLSPGFSTTDTVGDDREGETYTVAAGATPIAITVDDDDAEFSDGFIDPPGGTTASNNQLLAAPVTINGTSYGPASASDPPEGQVELEFAFTTTAGDTYYVVRIDGVNVGLSGPTLPQPGQVFTIDSASDGEADLFENIPCFVGGTRIETPDGLREVEALRPGDLVLTVDHGALRLKDVLRRTVSVAELVANPHLRPISFLPGAIGNRRELTVSPQHRMLISGSHAELHFGEPEVLVAAKFLVNGNTVIVAPLRRPVTYHHLLFEGHQLVWSEGAISESMDPFGNVAERSGEKAELEELFPQLQTVGSDRAPSRRVLRRHEAAVLQAG